MPKIEIFKDLNTNKTLDNILKIKPDMNTFYPSSVIGKDHTVTFYYGAIRGNNVLETKEYVCWLVDENLSLKINHKWENAFEKLGGGILGQVNTILGMFGGNVVSAASQQKMWMGTDPVKFNVKVLFEAGNNAKTQVWEPLWNIVKLSMPRKDGSALKVFQTAVNKLDENVGNLVNEILKGFDNDTTNIFFGDYYRQPNLKSDNRLFGVRIGNMVTFKDIYIDDVDIDISLKEMQDINGRSYPTMVQLNLSMSCMYMWHEDIIQSFIDNGLDYVDTPSTQINIGSAVWKFFQAIGGGLAGLLGFGG